MVAKYLKELKGGKFTLAPDFKRLLFIVEGTRSELLVVVGGYGECSAGSSSHLERSRSRELKEEPEADI